MSGAHAAFDHPVDDPRRRRCGYTPPRGTDTAAPKYETDRDACESSVPDAVDKRNAKTGLAWFAGGVTRWSQISEGVNACMADKGWGRTRACTADELKQGSRAPNLIVTAGGVRCSDPARPARP